MKLASIVPWALADAEYGPSMSEGTGRPALPARVAVGALVIKERLGVTDRETVEQIRENPYLQYFLDFGEYQDALPLMARVWSLLVVCLCLPASPRRVALRADPLHATR